MNNYLITSELHDGYQVSSFVGKKDETEAILHHIKETSHLQPRVYHQLDGRAYAIFSVRRWSSRFQMYTPFGQYTTPYPITINEEGSIPLTRLQ